MWIISQYTYWKNTWDFVRCWEMCFMNQASVQLQCQKPRLWPGIEHFTDVGPYLCCMISVFSTFSRKFVPLIYSSCSEVYLTGTFLTWNVSELFWFTYICLLMVLKLGLLTNFPKVGFTSSWQLLWPVNHLSMNIVFLTTWCSIQFVDEFSETNMLCCPKRSFSPPGDSSPWLCGFILVLCQQFVLFPPLPQATAELCSLNSPEVVLQITFTSHLW